MEGQTLSVIDKKSGNGSPEAEVAVKPTVPAAVVHGDPEIREMKELITVVQPLVSMVLQSQETVAREHTKQAEIAAKYGLRIFMGLSILVAMIIGVAICALYLRESVLTEKIIIGLLAFLSGVVFGTKASGK